MPYIVSVTIGYGAIRFLALTDKDAMKDKEELSIKIRADPARGVLHITDTGIGMCGRAMRAEVFVNLVLKLDFFWSNGFIMMCGRAMRAFASLPEACFFPGPMDLLFLRDFAWQA
jgi:hypothetical protein